MPESRGQSGIRDGVLGARQTGVRSTRDVGGLFLPDLLRRNREPGDQRGSSRLEGCHEVPIRKIIDRWGRSIANAAAIASEVDRLYIYDNSVDDRDAELVVRVSEGHLVRTYVAPPNWMLPILDVLTPRD